MNLIHVCDMLMHIFSYEFVIKRHLKNEDCTYLNKGYITAIKNKYI